MTLISFAPASEPRAGSDLSAVRPAALAGSTVATGPLARRVPNSPLRPSATFAIASSPTWPRLLGLWLAVLFVAFEALAAVRVVPPHPDGGRQAKVRTAFQTNDGSLLGPEPGTPNLGSLFSVLTEGGDGYLRSPGVLIVSAAGSGASGFTFINIRGQVEELFVSGGSGYSDDVTIVIEPPRTGDFQAALDDATADAIQLETGTYFQNAVITRDVTIQGRGRGRTFISGGLLGSVFHVQPGKTLRLQDVTIFDGLAENGGGIYNDSGTVIVERCEIRNCRAYGRGGEGGGIYNRGSAVLTLLETGIHDNIATRAGGGISNSGINTSVLPVVAGLTEAPANVLRRVFTDLAAFRPPDSAASQADQFDAALDQLDGIMESVQGMGSATDVFASVGPDLFASSANWNGFGLPVTRIIRSDIYDNQAGKGVGTARPVKLECPIHVGERCTYIGGDLFNPPRLICTPTQTPLPCYYTTGSHDIRFLAWGAGIHNDLGLLTLDQSSVRQNKNRTDLGAFGGGISSFFGAVKSTQSKLDDNTAESTTILSSGGALHAFASVAQIVDTGMRDNDVKALFLSSGGAIKNTGVSVLDLQRSQAVGNTSGGGGALANDYLSIANVGATLLSSNTVTGIIGAYGGGVRNENGGHVVLLNSTLDGNLAKGKAKGGGLYNQCETNKVVRVSTATLVNCTISGNRVDGVGAFGIPLEALGAGLYNGSADQGAANLFLTSCTIANNTASGGLLQLGGGLYNTALSTLKLKVTQSVRGISTVQIANNLFANNPPGDLFNNYATLTAQIISLGYNLDSDGSGALAALPSDPLLGSASFRTASDPLLSPLQFNGGPAWTHALLPGSPALENGSPGGTPAEAFSLATDQRGADRALGGRRDIGAFEAVAARAAADAYETPEDTALVAAAPGVMVNDLGAAPTAQLVAAPDHGSVVLQANGAFRYTPAAGYIGPDSFVYHVLDASGSPTAPAPVSILVQPRLDLVSITPGAGASAQRFTDVVLTFDEPVSAADVLKYVSLQGSSSGPRAYSVSISGNVVTLDPAADFARGETVTVSIDRDLRSAAGSILWPVPSDHVFTIFPNRAATVADDAYTLNEGGSLQASASQGLLANDAEPDGDPMTVTGVFHRDTLGRLIRFYGAQNFEFQDGEWIYRLPVGAPVVIAEVGQITLGADGGVEFTPLPDFSGVHRLGYDATDAFGARASGTLTLTVTPSNDAPVARDDAYSALTRTVSSTLIGVLVNDSDVEGDSLEAVIETAPARGSVVLQPNGTFVYTPGPAFQGADVFTYRASDGAAASAPARVKIGNTPPVAQPDAYPAPGGSPLVVSAASGLLANDTDADGDPRLTARLVAAPAHGQLALNTDGSFTYTPGPAFQGGDTFRYQANDGALSSAAVRVKIGNRAPVAVADAGYSTPAGTALVISASQGVLGNDTDADLDSLTAVLVSGPANGSLVLNADGSFTYTPAANFSGADNFTYAARDGLQNSPAATVTITVTDILRALAYSPARFSSIAPLNTPIRMTFNSAINAASLTGRIAVFGALSGRHAVTASVNGAEVTLQSLENFQPGESVSVTVSAGVEGAGLFRLARGMTWSFTAGVARGGAFFTAGPTPPVAPNQESAVLGDLNGDGRVDAFVQSRNAAPRLYFNQGNAAFTDRAEPLGLDWSFTLLGRGTLADLNGDGALDLVVNRGSTSASVSAGINDGAGNFTAIPLPEATEAAKFLMAGDFDFDGDLDLFAVGSVLAWLWRNDSAGHFILGPSVTVFPQGVNGGNFVNDLAVGDADGDGDLDVYLANLAGDKLLLNDGAGGFTLDTQRLDAASKRAVRLADVDADGDLDLVLSTLTHGMVWLNESQGRFARSGFDFSSNIRATRLAVGDLDGDADLDLFQANDSGGETAFLNDAAGTFTGPPQTLGASFSTDAVLADLDGDGDLDAFTVGGVGATAASAEVWLNQTAPNARDDFYAANGNNPVTAAAAAGVLANDTAGDGGAFTAALVSNGSRGSVTLNANGAFTYTPGGSFAGADVFTYLAVDSVQSSRVARVKIGNSTSTAVADGPFAAVNDAPLRVPAPGVLANDFDPEADPLNAIVVTPPSHGTLLLRADGSFAYQAESGYTGPDSFTYRASDGVASSSPVSVTLEVRSRLALIAATPSPNATHAAAGGDVVLRFNRALNPATVNANIMISGRFTGGRAVTTSVVGDIVTVNPAGSFLAGEEITVVLKAGLEGAGGERQVAPFQFQFRVEAPFGRGAFADSGQRIGDVNYHTIGAALGDLDGDGDLDAFLPNSIITINTPPFGARVWFNNGAGALADSGQALGAVLSTDAVLADLDGDGRLDAVIQTALPAGLLLFFNNGAGQFTASAQTLSAPDLRQLLAADVDNDGDNDLVAMGATSLKVWLNNGTGTFTEFAAASAGLNLQGLNLGLMRLADVNADGALDLLVRQVSANQLSLVFFNDGRGVFSDPGVRFGVGGPSLAAGDLNGDGALDAFAPAVNAAYVWRNAGAGAFASNGQVFGNFSGADAELGDFDGDGALDAAVIQTLSGAPFTDPLLNRSTVYFNDGAAQFTAANYVVGAFGLNSSGGGVVPRAVVAGDLNGDGALDLFLTGGQGRASQIWFNQAAAGPIEGAVAHVIDDNQTVAPFAGMIFRGPLNVTVSITLDDLAKGGFTPASLAAAGFTGPVGNTFTRAAGSAASSQLAVRQLVFTPARNRVPVGSSETTAFTVQLADGVVTRTDTGASVTSISVNEPPFAVADGGSGFTTTDTAPFTTGSVLANDTDPDPAETLSVVALDASLTVGVVTLQPNGTFRYDPSGRFVNLPVGAVATDTFAYLLRDAAGLESSAAVTITVIGSNQAPGAFDDAVMMNQNSSALALTALLLANDTDPDTGDRAALVITSVDTAGTSGQVRLLPGNVLTYQPAATPNLAPAATALDSFRYTLSDGRGGTASARVNVTITGVNDAPAAVADAISVPADAPRFDLTAALLGNDTDPDPGETAALRIVEIESTGTRGAAQFATTGEVFYQPTNFAFLAAGELGTDQFTYVVSDVHGATAQGVVVFEITGVNDAPTAAEDHVVFNAGDAARDITAELTANDTDVDGPASALVITGVTPGASPKGAVSFANGAVTYRPDPSLVLGNQQTATDTFTYTLADASGATGAGAVTVHIIGRNTAPIANAASFSINEDQTLSGAVTGSDADNNTLTFTVAAPPAHGVLTLQTGGQFTYVPAPEFNGADSFTFTANDGSTDSAAATVNLTVNAVNDPPALASSPASLAAQYSDPLPTVTVTASDIDSSGSGLAAATSWRTGAGAFTAGLPGGMAFAQSSASANARTWTLSGLPQLAPGDYAVRITVEDDGNASGALELPLTIAPEDARVTYTGSYFASTASSSSGTAAVTLSATIQDITAVAGDPAYDAAAGDIRNARATFINRDNNTIIAAELPIGLVNPADTMTGAAAYQWNVDLGAADSQTFTIGIIVTGWHARDTTMDDTVLTVAKPLANGFVTGGGFLNLVQPAGIYAGSVGAKCNFGFNAKVKNNGLEGDLNVVIRHGSRVYQIDGAALTSLSVAAPRAALSGRARFLDITDDDAPVVLDADAIFQVKLTDNGNPGISDTLALTLWNNAGGLWFASRWDGAKTIEQTLGGGNLKIHASGNAALASLPGRVDQGDEKGLLTLTHVIDSERPSSLAPLLALRFAAPPGSDYTIERTSDFKTWTPAMRGATYAWEAVVYFEAAGAEGLEFYRLRISGPESERSSR